LLTPLLSPEAAHRYADGSLVLSATMFFALFLLLRCLTGKNRRPFSSVRVRLVLAALALAFPLVLGAALGRMSLGVFSAVLW